MPVCLRIAQCCRPAVSSATDTVIHPGREHENHRIKNAERVVLDCRGYFPYYADPGELEFWAKTESTSSVTVDVKAGDTAYVRGSVGVGFFVGRP